jgi:hypothetical protein
MTPGQQTYLDACESAFLLFCERYPDYPQMDAHAKLYSRMDEELEQRVQEAEIVGVGFDVPAYAAPKCSKTSLESELEVAA